MIDDFILEVFFKRLIVRVFGIHTRYIFLRLIGKKIKFTDLRGKSGNLASESANDFANAVVGFISLFAVAALIAYLLFGVLDL